jgi:hypothetical protein
MSIELANARWLDGHEDGLLGQFASTRGYSDLIRAASSYAALSELFRDGATEKVDEARKELAQLVKRGSPDVASTARALLELSDGQEMLIITNGAN